MDHERIAPACLIQPEDGAFGKLTVVQGAGFLDYDDSVKKDSKEVMELSDLRVFFLFKFISFKCCRLMRKRI